MKRAKRLRRGLALLLAGAAAFPVYGSMPRASAAQNTDENFHQELAGLIKSQDDSAYFDSMELKIGSNVLTVDGQAQKMDVAPAVENGRTMLPIRAIAEAAGADVSYESDTQTAVITSVSGDEIRCVLGDKAISVNGIESAQDVAAYAENGRTYLPVRAVAEALDMEVDWTQETSTVTLTAPYQNGRLLVLANSLDTSGLNASKAIYDGAGMWVLQFESPAAAREAQDILRVRGVEAEPDLYIPPETGVAETNSAAGQAGIAAQAASYSWGVADCHFDDFVQANSFSGSGVVAVVDSGVDDSHPFLKGRVLSGKDFIDGDNDPHDENSHGTHVAGTIIDCVGDAPVKILPVRVLNAKGSGSTSAVASGIKYAADQGADVINLSLGGGHSIAKDAAIEYATGKGTLVAVAAGNESVNTSQTCPAHITSAGVVIVSAGDSKHDAAYFTNYGTSVDLMAPGVGIRAAVPGGGYSSKSGTSMATPHVAAAAILLDLASGKSQTPAQLEAAVQAATTGNSSWKNNYMGYGFLDMSKASVTPVKPVTPVTPDPEPVTPDPDPVTPDPEPSEPITPSPSGYKDPEETVQPYVPTRPSPATAGTTWVTNVRCKVGIYDGTYTGEWKNNQPHGQGLFVYDDLLSNTGRWYVGSFQNGLRHGYGEFYHTNKIYYEGQWKENSQGGGRGVQYTTTSILERDFSADYYSRHYATVTYTAKDSSKRARYEGYMKNGRYDGQGTLTMANGKVFSGVWSEGRLDSARGDSDYPYLGFS